MLPLRWLVLRHLRLGQRRATQGRAVTLLLADAGVLAARNAMRVDVVVSTLRTIVDASVDLLHALCT